MNRLCILIPTYNRGQILVKNLHCIGEMIEELGLQDFVSIIISDNNSDMDTQNLIEQNLIPNIDIAFYKQTKNLGFEGNCCFLLSKNDKEYSMLLGDDDFLNKGYLAMVVKLIQDDNISCIIPNFYCIDENGNRKSDLRDAVCEDSFFSQDSNMNLVVKAHQLSGLVFQTEGTLEAYRANVSPNDYLQMYFLGFNMMRGTSVFITRFPLQVTKIEQKNFSYSYDNLMPELLKNVIPLYELCRDRAFLRYFCRYNLRRFCNRNTMKNPIRFFKHVSANYPVDFYTKQYIMKLFFSSYIILLIDKLKRR